MDADPRFYWLLQRDAQRKLEYVVLGYRETSTRASSLEAWVVPAHGSNLCRLAVDGQNVIDFDPDLLLARDFTGTPVLYPTPNRVRNGVFRYGGRAYPQVKRGKTVLEHGLVHDEPWSYSEPLVSSAGLVLKTWIDFGPASPWFEAFPFAHRLGLEYRLTRAGIQAVFEIDNRDSRAIPFGFGLHPYFMKLSGNDGTTVVLPAECVMEATPDLLPTGRLIPVPGSKVDVRRETSVGALALDHIFTGVPAGQIAEVGYPSQKLRVRLVTSPEFSHLVLYTPRGAAFFCLENQTCSADAHNLYDHGYRAESGLRFVPAGGTASGSVTYQVVRGA
jgi:aldose 1-epimerase